ncbi:IS1380 family transposase [candidate division KSB1 bacterium]
MKIKTEFTADNLTIFGGYFNIFNFFVKSKVFNKLDKFISVKRRKKIYKKLDYIKIFMTMLIFGFKNMNQVSLLNRDKFVLNLLGLEKFPHASNIEKFLKKFRYKHCQQIVDVKIELFKKFHKMAFNLKRMTIDIDTTVLNIWDHQEGAEKGYNDVKRGNRCYHPILAFVYETKELLHGILKPGDSYCSNGAVEFIKELMTMIPYGIYDITFRADCGFFSQEILEFLEKMKFKYIIAVKNYPTILNKVISIKDIAFFHYRLKRWDIKRKFIVVRTPKEDIDPQLDMFGNERYEYQILVTNINDDPKKLVYFYRKRGNAENYIKEQKYDLNIGKLNTDSFWANQAIFQFMIICYNMLV